jgi:hypothetical protein
MPFRQGNASDPHLAQYKHPLNSNHHAHSGTVLEGGYRRTDHGKADAHNGSTTDEAGNVGAHE